MNETQEVIVLDVSLLPNETQKIEPVEEAKAVAEVHLNLLSDGLRIAGLVMMSVAIALSVFLAAWVVYNRKAPVVRMMQPNFLLMICFGTTLTAFTIMCMGSNDQNTEHINAACLAWPWLAQVGSTVTLSALFSKLWRVNEIFHAQGFQRKVVTARDVMGPFLILMCLNLTLLILMSILDPFNWTRIPISENIPNSTVGFCTYESWVGELLDALMMIVSTSALVILCVQAYRAKDIKSDFSEARGVALALFCWLQSALIVYPTQRVISPLEIDARYALQVMQIFVNHLSTLLFIFIPLILHHRRRTKYGSSEVRTQITGLDMTSGGTPNNPQRNYRFDDNTAGSQEQRHNHGTGAPEMELEVQRLRALVAELQSNNASAPQAAESNGNASTHLSELVLAEEGQS